MPVGNRGPAAAGLQDRVFARMQVEAGVAGMLRRGSGRSGSSRRIGMRTSARVAQVAEQLAPLLVGERDRPPGNSGWSTTTCTGPCSNAVDLLAARTRNFRKCTVGVDVVSRVSRSSSCATAGPRCRRRARSRRALDPDELRQPLAQLLLRCSSMNSVADSSSRSGSARCRSRPRARSVRRAACVRPAPSPGPGSASCRCSRTRSS